MSGGHCHTPSLDLGLAPGPFPHAANPAAFLTDHEPVDAILRHLDLPATLPPLSPARDPPQPDLGFDPGDTLDLDQTPAFDPAEPEPDPDLEFDQSRGGLAELRLATGARTRPYALQPQPWSRNDPSNWPTTHTTHTAMAPGPYRHAAQGEDRA